MKPRLASVAVCLLAIGMASPVLAQQYPDNPGGQDQGRDDNGRDGGRDDGHRRDARDDGPRDGGPPRGDGPRGDDRDGPRGWNRGDHYDGNRQFVDDWRGRGLREPPRGHRWVRDQDGDYVLVALATGIITDLLLNTHGR